MSGAAAHDHFISAADGTRLHVLDSGPARHALPLVCLPGLTRTVRDFAPVFDAFAGERRVVALSLRGRGKSDRADPQSYRPQAEAADTLGVLAALSIEHAIFIGTSRGGIVTMVIAAMARAVIAGAVFNDIGPAIMPEGLIRISGYLGQQPPLASWQAAIAALRASNPGFESLSDAEWLRFARKVFAANEAGEPVSDYDPRLSETFPSVSDINAGKVPELWDLFALLADAPLGVLRGVHSDLLSAATVARMQEMAPRLIAADVPERGHVPFLDEAESLAVIRAVIAAAEADHA